MSYRHLGTGQRYEIAVLKREGFSNSAIAKRLGVHCSTIGRELKRNGRNTRYGPVTADRRARQRRRAASSRPWRFTPEMRQQIEEKLRLEQWSPEQISSRMPLEGHDVVSHEWIYQHIWRDKADGGDLYKHLRQQKKRRKRYRSNDSRGIIPNRVSIDERPLIVEERSRIGDWEIDTIIGAGHKGAIVTSVERTSLYLVMRPLTSTKAVELSDTLVAMMRPHRNNVMTITADNGHEFARHETFAKELRAQVYFAHPYHSWERGTNENTNGLVRQYFPKRTNLLKVECEQVQTVADKLNNRPRKSLGWKSPREFFFGLSLSYFSHPP